VSLFTAGAVYMKQGKLSVADFFALYSVFSRLEKVYITTTAMLNSFAVCATNQPNTNNLTLK
jgi:hypothetical protein